jgi:DNA-binding transcriptional MerR regulator
MSGDGRYRIGDVVRRTGLTERAIRFYEKNGLLRAARTAAGQRVYGEDTLRTLAIVRVLKRAGFSLSEIRKLMQASMPVRSIVAAQMESLKSAEASIQQSIRLLSALQGELERDPGSEATILGRIADISEQFEPNAAWRAVFDRYFSKDRQAAWTKMNNKLMRSVDPKRHNEAWLKVIADIKAALPLDPASPKALQLLARWDELMAPFNRVATDRQKKEAKAFWSRVGEWGTSVNQPMTQAVADLIRDARLAKGKTPRKRKARS